MTSGSGGCASPEPSASSDAAARAVPGGNLVRCLGHQQVGQRVRGVGEGGQFREHRVARRRGRAGERRLDRARVALEPIEQSQSVDDG